MSSQNDMAESCKALRLLLAVSSALVPPPGVGSSSLDTRQSPLTLQEAKVIFYSKPNCQSEEGTSPEDVPNIACGTVHSSDADDPDSDHLFKSAMVGISV